MISPYKGTFKITQRYKGAAHKGEDVVGLTDKILRSVVNGVVVKTAIDSYPDGGMGHYIKLKDDATGYFVLYAHTSKFLCKPEDRVKIGDPVGVEGNTGHSFGSHCHLEVRASASADSYIDVSKFLGLPNIEGTFHSDPPHIKGYKEVQERYHFSDGTMQYLEKYDYAEALFQKMQLSRGAQNYQLETIQYILAYEYGKDVFQKLF